MMGLDYLAALKRADLEALDPKNQEATMIYKGIE